jgi:hypothetical protein
LRKRFYSPPVKVSKFTEKVDPKVLKKEALARPVDLIEKAKERKVYKFHGMIQSVTVRPIEGFPSLEAEIFDGTDKVTLIWLGRKGIFEIKPGRSLTFEGRLGITPQGKKIYNPRYWLDG